MRSFEEFGMGAPASPVVVSVPHAGRAYPPALLAALRVAPACLTALEDRHVDAVAQAARTDEAMLVQRSPRAWIDLNRAEWERDPRVDAGAPPGASSARVRGGLGLIPRRGGGAGELWRGRFTATAVAARIAEDHRPYHAALDRLLRATRDRWGVAVLLDLHSMPPLGPGQAQVVLGDRFGASAGARFPARLEAEVVATGLRPALNAPYAGGYIIERHGRPARGIHAVQMELDRTLYLDRRLDGPGPGLAATAALVGRCLAALREEALTGSAPLAQAAE